MDHNLWAAEVTQPLHLGLGRASGAHRVSRGHAMRDRSRDAAGSGSGPRRIHRRPAMRVAGDAPLHRLRGDGCQTGGRPPWTDPAGRHSPSQSVTTPRGRRGGPACRASRSFAHTPSEAFTSANLRFFTRTCVWRNLSKPTTVVQLGRPFERGRRDHHRRQCRHHCPGPLPADPIRAGACHEQRCHDPGGDRTATTCTFAARSTSRHPRRQLRPHRSAAACDRSDP